MTWRSGSSFGRRGDSSRRMECSRSQGGRLNLSGIRSILQVLILESRSLLKAFQVKNCSSLRMIQGSRSIQDSQEEAEGNHNSHSLKSETPTFCSVAQKLWQNEIKERSDDEINAKTRSFELKIKGLTWNIWQVSEKEEWQETMFQQRYFDTRIPREDSFMPWVSYDPGFQRQKERVAFLGSVLQESLKIEEDEVCLVRLRAQSFAY
jgi:hypothetical protein